MTAEQQAAGRLQLLVLSQALRLPADAVTQTFAIFGKRGSGKSNTGVVMAEEMYRVGACFAVLDPIGAWWGLKSSFDGKERGLPVYVFGGDHADLPLQPTAGELMARVLIEHRIPMVLDMKGWGVGERARFVTAFALYLLGHNNRQPLHVFIEEADAYVPQRPQKGEEQMLSAMDRLVRWGRQEGIGATLITQRSAKVNKDVTTQAETLIAHRTVGPQDRDAIDSWIKFHADSAERSAILAELPTLPAGTAWIWSPEWLGILKKVAIRRRQTFDSASTPKMGQRQIKPKVLAPIDVSRLRDQLETVIEQAQADDPRLLRKRIKELEKAASRVPEATVKVETREVSILTDSDRAAVAELQNLINGLITSMAPLIDALPSAGKRFGLLLAKSLPAADPTVSVSRDGQPPKRTKAVTPRVVEPNGTGDTITPPLQRIIDAVGWWESLGVQPDRIQVGFISNYSARSSGFKNNISTLRGRGLIDYPGARTVCLTDEGRALANPATTPKSDEALQAMVYRQLPAPQQRILRVVVDAYPDSVSREAVSEATDYSLRSSGFKNNISALRVRRLIDYAGQGELVAAPILFLSPQLAGRR